MNYCGTAGAGDASAALRPHEVHALAVPFNLQGGTTCPSLCGKERQPRAGVLVEIRGLCLDTNRIARNPSKA